MTTMSAEATFRLLVTDRIFESHGGVRTVLFLFTDTPYRQTDRQTDSGTPDPSTHKK